MPDTIAKTKDARETPVPTNICILKHVDKDIQSNEESRHSNLKQLPEEKRMLDQVESLSHIGLARKDFTIISKEIPNSLNNHPGTHCGRGALLVCILKIIKFQTDSEKKKSDPVK